MKILIHDYGGYEFPLQLSRELAGRGHQVVHLYVNFLKVPRGEFAQDHSIPGLTISPVAMHPDYERRKYSFPHRFAMNLAYARRLLAEVMLHRPDVVLSGNTPTEIQLPLSILCRLSGIRFVNWVQDFFSVAVRRVLSKRMGWLGHALGIIYEQGDKAVILLADSSILITADFRKQLDKWGMGDRGVSVIPNWASIEKFGDVVRRNPWSESLGLHDKFVFLYSGTLGLKHNPGLFLRLAREFRGDNSVAVVVVAEGAGADQLRLDAEKAGLDNLLALPYQSPDLVPAVLASGDVLMAVLERDAGAFSVPSKVLTYLCAGRPVLLSVPGENLAARMVTDHGMGLVSEPGDEVAFLANAHRLRESSDLRSALGRNAGSYAREYFPIARIAERFELALSSSGLGD